MPIIADDFSVFGMRPEPRDDKIERLARECERKALLLKMQKSKTLQDFQRLQKELEDSVEGSVL